MRKQQGIKQRVSVVTLIVLLIGQTGCTLFGNSQLASGADYGPLHLGVSSNYSRIQPGNNLRIRFGVRNNSNETIILESPGTPVMDIRVKVVGGPELLTWSSQNPDKVSHRIEWKPGESKVIELTWLVRQEDVAYGHPYYIDLAGFLNSESKLLQAAGVIVCASNACR